MEKDLKKLRKNEDVDIIPPGATYTTIPFRMERANRQVYSKVINIVVIWNTKEEFNNALTKILDRIYKQFKKYMLSQFIDENPVSMWNILVKTMRYEPNKYNVYTEKINLTNYETLIDLLVENTTLDINFWRTFDYKDWVNEHETFCAFFREKHLPE